VRIEFTFSRDEAYFRELAGPWVRYRTLALDIAGWVALLVGLATISGAAVVGVAIGTAGLVLLVIGRVLRRRLVTMPAAMAAPRRWLVTDDGVTSHGELSDTEHAWTVVRQAGVLPSAYVLHLTGSPLMVDLPRSPLTADQDAELRTFLVGRGLLAAA
jgi:hypothetical protein